MLAGITILTLDIGIDGVARWNLNTYIRYRSVLAFSGARFG